MQKENDKLRSENKWVEDEIAKLKRETEEHKAYYHALEIKVESLRQESIELERHETDLKHLLSRKTEIRWEKVVETPQPYYKDDHL